MGLKIIVNSKGAADNVAPNEVYERLAEKLINAYHQWGIQELQNKKVLVDLGKIRHAVLESAEYMLGRLESSEFTVIEQKGGDDGEKQN